MPVHTVLLLIFILKDPVNNINLRLRFRIVEQYSLVSVSLFTICDFVHLSSTFSMLKM